MVGSRGPGAAGRYRKRGNPNGQLRAIQKDLQSRAFLCKAPANPPPNINAGDVWHDRRVTVTSLADSNGQAVLTAGALMGALSGNSANVPVRIARIMAYAIAGTAGTYPPTFLQVDFYNEEFMQSVPGVSSVRDSFVDGGGMGAGPPGVALYVPTSQRLVRNDWAPATSTTVANATGIQASARVMWYITLQFKF